MFADVWQCHGITALASPSPHERAHGRSTMIVRRRKDLGSGGNAEDRPPRLRRGGGRPSESAAMRRIDLRGRGEEEDDPRTGRQGGG